jgi:hypothetical protein
MAALQGGDWFPERTTGKDSAAAGLGASIKKDQIDIPIQAEVLKTIVEYDRVNLVPVNRLPGRKEPAAAGKHRHSRQGFGKEIRFIACLDCGEEKFLVIGDNVHRCRGTATIAAADNRRPETLLLEEPANVLHNRCFPGAAKDQIPHRDDRDRQFVLFEDSPSITPGAKMHCQGVNRAEWTADKKERIKGICHSFLPGNKVTSSTVFSPCRILAFL